MDQPCADSNVSLSPSKILDRLQVLRQLQMLQRGKLQRHRLEYQDSPETSSSITEIVSHFSNSTSYNTFRSLLQSSHETYNDVTPRSNTSNLLQKVKDHDLVEGVSVLNLSQESEYLVQSPISTKSNLSAPSRSESIGINSSSHNDEPKPVMKKQIALDEMPILSHKQDFETLVIEKLKNYAKPQSKSPKKDVENCTQNKKPFLKRGEGIARFGLKKNSLVIENTKSLPWRRKSLTTKVNHTPKKVKQSEKDDKVDVQIMVNDFKKPSEIPKIVPPLHKPLTVKEKPKQLLPQCYAVENSVDSSNCEMHSKKSEKSIQFLKEKHPLQTQKGKTWAAVLTKEQDDFLRQLKQSDYYKNFVSPAKSTISNASCDENLYKLRQERERAEQNMFELLENKVGNESFNLENSFFCKFLKRNLESSGESTPLVMQKCLANNPALMHIFSDIHHKKDDTQSDADTCSSQYTDCSDDCSSASCCCSCNTVEENRSPLKPILKNKKEDLQKEGNEKRKEAHKAKRNNDCQDDTVTEDDTMNANMADMNAKLLATSELLKERLHELEDEIEKFKNENANLAKMREDIDLERQKFYEEKNAFEQKYNEEKVLSEYYLAEEKEKLTKQKQQYERYVREMRGRLNKKEKDEVINLKKEISDLKEEIRIKDAKSTSTIARLRNQIKIMEKEKDNLQKEVEKLKKENRRIQHSNEVTRRLTNLKYLEQINKKLTNMSKNTQSEVGLDTDVKYKAYEIERQSRSRKVEPAAKGLVRPRAKSVPNLKVTSRYAKYFSQRDAVSQLEKNDMTNFEIIRANSDDDSDSNQNNIESEFIQNNDNSSNNDDDNNIERIYLERFQSEERHQSGSSKSNSNGSNLSNTDKNGFIDNPDPYFIRKSLSDSKESILSNHLSPRCPSLRSNGSKSPISILSNRSDQKSPTFAKDNLNYSKESNNSQRRSGSPVSNLSKFSGSQRSRTIINQGQYRDKLSVTPEPSTSKTSLTKTSLNPTEIKKSDGSKELRFPNGNVKYISADGKYTKFIYYNGDVKENFFSEGRIKYFYADAKTYHTTHADGLEVLEFPDGQVEKRYKDGSSEIRLPNGSIRYFDPKNKHVKEEWRFPDGTVLTIAADGEQKIVFSNGQVEVHAKDHKRREFPDGTVKLVYNDGTSETRYASGRVRIKDKHGNLIMDSSPG
ncbi:centromere protein J [Hyposmocoma kahamanoa]|uniref:centromere protein J n=1 Tax=Hyposmocoma kahamanoa TaxID=1477025 RepID=UPI000E6D8B39|nr:centromere protein J [Hyposmocoma kahamanoa]